MNRAYRLVWNEERNSWVAAPEIASARGKRGGVRRGAATLLLALAAGSHASLAADLAPGALPGGGQVTAGQASIGSSGANMAIDQGSQRAIINWQNFDIGSQASVTFRQPDASAVALNRVSGPTASRIEGQLTANGQVFLINPSGVLFGKGARVHVGGLVASTLNIRDDDFLSGNFVFSGNGGSIANEGRITAAPGGYLAFISPAIANSGAVSAPQGTVAMGAGERVRLNFAGDRLVGLDVSAAAIDTLIENRQAIRAEGGAILLTAAGAEAVTRGVINNSGVLEASSLTSDGGRIVLTAGNDITLGAGSTVAVDGKKGGEITVQARTGTLLADGSLAARGAAGKGGDIQLLGHQVGLVNAAQVDASGATGGGTVLVGGDYQGANAGVQNAFRTYVGPQSTITADALQQGDGGKVIVWADDATRFYGSISARGGSQSGNGGFVETSGKEYLEANGSVDASAPAGLAGQWLLDPRNITINTAGPTSGGTALPNFDATADNAVVDRDDIQTSLNTGTNVTITTGSTGTQAGNITVASAIAKTAGGNATLTLNAANNIVFNSGANVGSTAGQLGFTLNAGGGINNLRGVSLNGGTLTLNAAGAVTQSSPITGNTTVVKNGAGTFTLSQSNTYTGATTVNAGTLALGASNVLANGSSLVVNGGTFNIANRSDTVAGVQLLSGAITGTTGTLTSTSAYDVQAGTVSARLGGTAGLTKTTSGTVTLSGANTYTGATNINAGTLALGASNIIANASAVTVAAGATFNLAGYSETIGSLAGAGTVTKTGTGVTTLAAGADNTSTTFSGVIQNPTGTLNLTKTGAGALTLSGANTYRGVTNVNAGTLVAANASALGAATAGVTVANGATLGMQGGITVGAEALSLRGTGVAGDGALRNLSGNNTWGGTVTLAGNAEIQSDAGTLTLSAANSVTGATRNLTVDGTGNTAINGTITTTSGALIKNGAGTLTLSGANTAYAGAISINAGTLAVTANNALGTTAAGTAVANGATLDFRNVAYATGEAVTLNGGSLATSAGTSSFAGPVTLGPNSNVDVAGTQLTLSGAIGGAGFGINKQGNGALVLSGNNTYTGATNINAGTLTATGGNAIADASQVNLADVAGATLGLAGNETIGNLAGGGASGGNVTLGGNTLTVNQTAATTYAGVISGTGDLTKTGTDTLTLAGSNTHTGMTNINAGALVAANAVALGAPAGGTSVGSNARLIIDGVAIGAEPVTLNGPGLFGAGAITSNGNASLTGPITLAADSIVAPNSGSVLTLAGAIDGAFALTKQGLGTLVLNGAVGGTTALTSLTTSAGGATAVGGGLVRTSGNQTYNDTVSLGAPTTLATTANGNITANGSVAANGNALTLNAGAGNVTMQNAANDFATVAIVSATNVALRDANAIDLGASAIGANLALTAGGAVTDSGALTVAGATALNAGTNDITLDNANDFRGNVAVQSGGNVRLNDINDLTLDLSGFSTLTATAGGTLTLAGRLTASGAGDAIVLSGGRFVNNAGATALSAPNGRWLVWSQDPANDTRGGLAYDFKQYNAIYGTTAVLGSGNGFLYSLVPTITPGLTGTVSKVYDTTTTAPLTSANFTPTVGVDGDVITLSGTGAYDNPNVAGSPTKLVTANGIAATVTSSVADGSRPVYGYTLTSPTASANIGEITPALLVITADNASRPVNTPNPQFTATYAGFVGGETPAVLNGVLAFSTPATLASAVGVYPITPYGQSSGNYTITYVDGKLTIQGSPVVTLPVFPREVVSQQAIGAQYTDPTMPTHALNGLHYVFDDRAEAREENVPATIVRVIGSGIRLPN
jgi:fibronectin-binding autotransporter adhesin